GRAGRGHRALGRGAPRSFEGAVRRYVLRRLAALAVPLFFVSVLVFVVIRVLPGDPAMIILGTEGSPEAAAQLRRSMGLDRPLVVQYVEWIGRGLRGDLGRSIQYDVPVASLILSRMNVTLPLALLAAVLMIAAGVLLRGVGAATPPARGGLHRDDGLPVRRGHPRVLGRAAPDPALLREARLGAIGRLRRLGPGPLAGAALADLAGCGARPVPAGGARAHHPLGGARGPGRGGREDPAGQGRGRGRRRVPPRPLRP